MTELSNKIAANALCELYTRRTGWVNVGARPPAVGSPHAPRVPSEYTTQNAVPVEYIASALIFARLALMAGGREPPDDGSPQATTSPLSLMAAKAHTLDQLDPMLDANAGRAWARSVNMTKRIVNIVAGKWETRLHGRRRLTPAEETEDFECIFQKAMTKSKSFILS
jgi:hypothetical protein